MGSFKLQYNAHQETNAQCFAALHREQNLEVLTAPPAVELDDKEKNELENSKPAKPAQPQGDTHMQQECKKRTASEADNSLQGDTGAAMQEKWAHVRRASRKLEARHVRVDVTSGKDVDGTTVLCCEDMRNKIIRWLPDANF